MRGARLDPDYATSFDAPWVFVVARLRPGLEPTAVEREATTVFQHSYKGVDHATATSTVTTGPLTSDPHAHWSPEIRISTSVFGLSIVALLIALANTGQLLRVRLARRRRETAVRVALGATSTDLAVRAFLDAGVVGAAAGVGAAIVAVLLSKAVQDWMLPNVEWSLSTTIWRVLSAGFVGTVAVAAAIGLVLTRSALTTDVAPVLTGQHGPDRRRRRSYEILAVVQCAVSVLLLAIAGLFVRSVLAANAVEYGVDTQRTYLTSVEWQRASSAQSDRERKAEFSSHVRVLSQVVGALRRAPGIEGVALAVGLPFRGGALVDVRQSRVVSSHDALARRVSAYAVDEDYFTTVRTRLQQGRVFQPSDDSRSQRVVIVSPRAGETGQSNRFPRRAMCVLR